MMSRLSVLLIFVWFISANQAKQDHVDWNFGGWRPVTSTAGKVVRPNHVPSPYHHKISASSSTTQFHGSSIGSVDSNALSYLFNVPSLNIKPIVQPHSSRAFNYQKPLTSAFFWDENLLDDVATHVNGISDDQPMVPKPKPVRKPFFPRNLKYIRPQNDMTPVVATTPKPSPPPIVPVIPSPPLTPPSPPQLPPGPPYKSKELLSPSLKVLPKPLREARLAAYSVIQQLEANEEHEKDLRESHEKESYDVSPSLTASGPLKPSTSPPIKYRFFPLPDHRAKSYLLKQPKKPSDGNQMQTLAIPVKEIGHDYITVPVAVETDHDKVLTPDDIRDIEREVLNSIPDSLDSFAHDVPESMYRQAVPITPDAGPNGPRLALMEYPGPKGPMTYLITGRRKKLKIGKKPVVLATNHYYNSLKNSGTSSTSSQSENRVVSSNTIRVSSGSSLRKSNLRSDNYRLKVVGIHPNRNRINRTRMAIMMNNRRGDASDNIRMMDNNRNNNSYNDSSVGNDHYVI